MEPSRLLLKAAQIEQMEGEVKTHFLNPNAVRVNKSLGDAVGLNHIGVHLIYVEPGRDTTECHKHYYEEECVYVLAGTATAIIEGERFPLGAGDFIGLPRATAAHTIVNDGDETLVCLVMGQRLEQDVGDYPNLGKRLYRNSGVWDLVDIDAITVAPRGKNAPGKE